MEKQIVTYKPYTERTPDHQYESLLRDLIENGEKKTSIHASLPENVGSGHKFCLELPGRMLQYNLSNGAPITTFRDLDKYHLWNGAIGEIVGFINGARTLEELVSFGCPPKFWDRWVTAEKCAKWGLVPGDLGPGSYGPILTAMPMLDGRTFNQIEALMKAMTRDPLGRTNLLTTWYPPLALGDKDQESQRNVVVAPCHGNIVQFDVMDNMTMNMSVYQRSSDVPVGLVLNLCEWVSFGMKVAYLVGTRLSYYTHFLPNPQIYDIQIPIVQKMLDAQEARRLPSLYLDPQKKIRHITEFRKEDFVLSEYDPHPWTQIPTAI